MSCWLETVIFGELWEVRGTTLEDVVSLSGSRGLMGGVLITPAITSYAVSFRSSRLSWSHLKCSALIDSLRLGSDSRVCSGR